MPEAAATLSKVSVSQPMCAQAGKITAADRAIMVWVPAANSPVLDRALPALSRAADYSGLWIDIAVGLAATENKWARRAALRGLAGIAIASMASNVCGEGLATLIKRRDPLLVYRPGPLAGSPDIAAQSRVVGSAGSWRLRP